MRPGSRILAGRRTTRAFLLRYLLVLTAMNLAWEFAQMPLYTIGQTGTPGEIAFAALHCTLGDALIGGFAMLAALIVAAPQHWPAVGRLRVLLTAVLFGLAYTVFSEWMNTELHESWAYSALMPRLPPLGTGLSPILQWLILPPLAWAAAFTWLNPARAQPIDRVKVVEGQATHLRLAERQPWRGTREQLKHGRLS